MVPQDTFQVYLDILNSEPKEVVTVRSEYLTDDEVNPKQLAEVSERDYRRTVEVFRDDHGQPMSEIVFVFQPKRGQR